MTLGGQTAEARVTDSSPKIRSPKKSRDRMKFAPTEASRSIDSSVNDSVPMTGTTFGGKTLTGQPRP